MPGASESKKFSFTKKERLLKRAEFLAVTGGGKKSHTASFIIFMRPNTLGFSRIGITVSKKVGSAIERNRTKRLIREFFRLNKAGIVTGTDIVIIAKRGAADKDFKEVSRELGRALTPVSKPLSDDMEEKRD